MLDQMVNLQNVPWPEEAVISKFTRVYFIQNFIQYFVKLLPAAAQFPTTFQSKINIIASIAIFSKEMLLIMCPNCIDYNKNNIDVVCQKAFLARICLGGLNFFSYHFFFGGGLPLRTSSYLGPL